MYRLYYLTDAGSTSTAPDAADNERRVYVRAVMTVLAGGQRVREAERLGYTLRTGRAA